MAKSSWIGTACMLFAMLANAQQPATTAKPRLTGHVYDENGKPFAGAAVGAFAATQFVDTAALLAQPMATTGADGSYAIEVDTTLAYGNVVVAASQRQACALHITERLARDGGALDDALLLPGSVLNGRVRDERGAPLAGVHIAIRASVDEWSPRGVALLAGAISDARGIFQVPCVPRTGMRLTATLDGYATEVRLVAQQTPADLTLQHVGMVRGVVLDTNGAPVAGAMVWPETATSLPEWVGARCKSDGTFAFTVPTRDRFRVRGELGTLQFRSDLLHGAVDDVRVTAATWQQGTRAFTVVARDAATGAPIERFGLSLQYGFIEHQDAAASALFHHGMQRHDCSGKAELRTDPDGKAPFVVVDAPGHAFALAAVPDVLDGPLVVKLGPEAVLTGTVVDAETGKPLAGVAVRALPHGGVTGSGGSFDRLGPLSDARGAYRIGGLQPGNYSVQVHAADRGASAPVATTVAVDRANTLDLTAPARRWYDFELTGTLPAGPPCRVSLGPTRWSFTPGLGCRHSVQEPPPLSLTRAGKVHYGPVGDGDHELVLFVPSRTRIGTGTTIPLGDLHANGNDEFPLPELDRQLVVGRVRLPNDVPSERIAVRVRPRTDASKQKLADYAEPDATAIDGDGNFELDLPVGDYWLQLFDLASGIAFWTEPQAIAVLKNMAPLALRPAIHWLDIDLVPERTGGDVIVWSLVVDVPAPGVGTCGAFLSSRGGGTGIERRDVPVHEGARHLRWLVPAAHLALTANQNFRDLHATYETPRPPNAPTELDVRDPMHRVTLVIPPPPSDDELRGAK